MREKYCLAWLFIFIGTNLFAEAQGSLNVQVKAVEDNPSCVNVSWQLAGEAQYTINCTGTEPVEPEPDQTSPPQRVCRNYQPYTLVQCTVTSTSGESESGSGRTACAKPSLPTFKVKHEVGYQAPDGTPVMRRTIIVYDVAVKANCASLSSTIVMVYNSSESPVGSAEIVNNHELGKAYVIDNLDAVSTYEVRVDAINNGRLLSPQAVKYATTGPLPPGPVGDLSLSGTSVGCVEVNWSEPQQPRGDIVTYSVSCTLVGQTNAKKTNSTLNPSKLCGFGDFKNVSCSVAAINSEFIGTYISDFARTLCGKPSVPGFKLLENLSPDRKQIKLTVYNISVEPNCDSISEIILTLHNSNQQIDSKTLNASETSWTFSNLEAVTDYTVKVVAVNNDDGRAENSNSTKTGELAPDTPPNRFKLNFNSSCVFLDWRMPQKPNGNLLYYMVSCQNLTKTLPASVVNHIFCEFLSATPVNCSVSVNNSIGWSPAAMRSGYTSPKLARNLEPAEITPRKYEIQVEIKTVSFTREDLQVQHYQFVVETVGSTTRKKRDVSAVDVNQLFGAKEAATNGLSYYVAGEISDKAGEMIEFLCGDDEMYEGFHNKELEHKIQYKIHYTYTVKLGNTSQTYLVESLNAYELKLLSDGDIVLIVICPTVFVVVCLIALIYWRKRRNAPSGAQDRELTSSNATQLDIDVIKDTFSFTNAAKAVLDNNDMQHDNDHPRPSGANARRSGSDGTVQAEIAGPSQQTESSFTREQSPEQSYNPSAVQENEGSREGINRFVEGADGSRETEIKFCKEELNRCIQQDENKREEEFKNLKDPKSYGDAISVANCVENSEKNRYKYIWPTDQHRVILIDNPNSGGSDYINASFLPGFDKKDRFIAAMGPNAHSLNDFWWMLWQFKVETVVMLCKIFEGGKAKCEQYWPAEVGLSEKYGPLTVETYTEDSWAHFIIRTFKIRHEGGQTHRVMHYQYTNWPDHDVPKTTPPFVMFYEMIKYKEKRLASTVPIVVHCSAGVGRTGTFIAVDHLVEQGEKGNMLNFYKCVSLLRERRPAMVQTPIQYHFLHWALLEILENKLFQTNVYTLPTKIHQARTSPAQSVLAEEYKTIEDHLKNVDLRFSISEISETNLKLKNSDHTVLADDESRVYLQDKGEDESDYINAICVCSYKDIGKFIVAQNPIWPTFRDFYVMIHEQKVTNIVQLDSSELSHLPMENTSITVDGYKIEHMSTKIKGDIELIKLHMTPAHSTKEDYEEITVYKYLDWKHERTPPSEKSIIDLYKAVRLSSSTYINSPLVITCRNGAAKSGLFVNIYSILEKMEIEQVVDIYRSVQLTRIIRPHFINKLEDYIYLYEVVKTYNDRFATYSNLELRSQNQKPGPSGV